MIKAFSELWDFTFSRLVTTLPFLWLELRIALTQPEKTQERLRIRLLKLMKGSDYLNQWQITPRCTRSEFQRRLPIVSYDEIAAFIKDVYNGKTTALFNSRIKLRAFALTSGTSGPRKLIPLTAASFRAIRKAFWFIGVRMLYKSPGNQIRGILSLASSPSIERSPNGLPCGEITGMIVKKQPSLFKSHYVMPEEVSEIQDPELKYYVSLRIALNNPRLMVILTATPATLTTLAEYLERHACHFISDIAGGKCWRDDEIPAAIRSRLGVHLHYQSERRARQLRALLLRHGRLLPCDCWPRLQIVSTWLSGSFHHYRKKIARLYQPDYLWDTGLSASEGHFTLPLYGGSYHCLLNIWSYYYEFIDDVSRILGAHELEIGQTYRLVVSTPGGLLRYDMHDLVKVVGYRSEIPLIEFERKDRDYLDLTGEKLSAAHASQVVAKTFGDETRFFVKPNSERNGFVFYFIADHSGKSEQLDRELAKLNACYAEHRSVGKLAPLAIKRLDPNNFTAIDQRTRKRRGGSFEQYKPVILLDDECAIEGDD